MSAGTPHGMPGLYTTLYTKVLMYTAANSRNGLRPVFRDDYFRNMRKIMGPSVKWLEVLETLEELERDGEVWIEHLGSEDFKVWLTEKSLQRFRHTTLPPRDVRGAPTSSGPSVEVAHPIKDDSTPSPTSDDALKVEPETSTSANPPMVEDPGPQSRNDPPMSSTDLTNNPETSPRVSPTEDPGNAVIEQHLRKLEETQRALARREKALNDRLVCMVEHERELIRREEEFEEIRKSLEESLAKRRWSIWRPSLDHDFPYPMHRGTGWRHPQPTLPKDLLPWKRTRRNSSGPPERFKLPSKSRREPSQCSKRCTNVSGKRSKGFMRSWKST